MQLLIGKGDHILTEQRGDLFVGGSGNDTLVSRQVEGQPKGNDQNNYKAQPVIEQGNSLSYQG